jgi:hypothetical protein
MGEDLNFAPSRLEPLCILIMTTRMLSVTVSV